MYLHVCKKRKPRAPSRQAKRISSSRDLKCKDHVENWVIKYSRDSFARRSCAHSPQNHSKPVESLCYTTINNGNGFCSTICRSKKGNAGNEIWLLGTQAPGFSANSNQTPKIRFVISGKVSTQLFRLLFRSLANHLNFPTLIRFCCREREILPLRRNQFSILFILRPNVCYGIVFARTVIRTKSFCFCL